MRQGVEGLREAVRKPRSTRCREGDSRATSSSLFTASLKAEALTFGRGFDAASVEPGRLGLATMLERAAEMGADLDMSSQVGGGTVVTLTWLAAAPQAA